MRDSWLQSCFHYVKSMWHLTSYTLFLYLEGGPPLPTPQNSRVCENCSEQDCALLGNRSVPSHTCCPGSVGTLPFSLSTLCFGGSWSPLDAAPEVFVTRLVVHDEWMNGYFLAGSVTVSVVRYSGLTLEKQLPRHHPFN